MLIKPKAIPSFLGDVGLIKVVSIFGFGRSMSHFWALETAKSAQFHFDCHNYDCASLNIFFRFKDNTPPSAPGHIITIISITKLTYQ